MWTQSEATTRHPSSPAMTEFEAAKACGIGDAFAGDSFSDDGNPLSPSNVPYPTRVGRKAREWAWARTIALFLPVAISALLPGCGADDGPRRGPQGGPPPSAMGQDVAAASTARGSTAGPGVAAADVASRYHRREFLQGPND